MTWLKDQFHLTLGSIPSATYYINIHHGTLAHDLQFLVLVHTGFHRHRIGSVGLVAVGCGSTFQYGCWQVALSVALV